MGSRVQEPVSDRHVGQRHLERLVMLSDGVFAIAITLSAIEIKPVAQPRQTLWQVWSLPLLIYFLSFLLIGSIWASHRRMVAHLRDVDAVGTAINLLLLSLVALIPVVVRFVFEGLEQGQGLLVYALALAVTYTCLALFWAYVAFIARLAPDLPPVKARAWLLEMVAAPLLMLALALYDRHLRGGALALTLLGVALLLTKSWQGRRERQRD